MEIITTATSIAGILASLKELLSSFTGKKQKAKGLKYKILTEIQFNIKLLTEHYVKNGLPVDKIIKQLQTNSLKEAFESGYNFKEITTKKISPKHINESKFLERYSGMSVEKYLDTIKSNIEQLKLCLDNYDFSKKDNPIRFNVRLKNLVKKYQLLHILLKDN